MIKKKFFKTKDECEVTFEVENEEAQTVTLVCDFNGWQPVAMKKLKKGPFKTKIRLPKASQFEFRYLVDGQQWLNDKAADKYSVNEHGSNNGVVLTFAES